jgi:hypothetical protein
MCVGSVGGNAGKYVGSGESSHNARRDRPSLFAQGVRPRSSRLRERFGMTPEEVRLDLAEADEFSVVSRSLLTRVPRRVSGRSRRPREES